MTEVKKIAYKKLIHQAFLDLKNSGTFDEVIFYRNFRIAHVFHNLAEFIVEDFVGFNEYEFWATVDALASQFDLHHYRKIFDAAVMER
ncbi:hypothetical protein P4V43_26890 [Brevibacillus fortis]|uniref:Uncharacterized protein n=1 Tax=Brevibacillus fortis TaxID=2126352 RepID=A0A2P7UFU7_9BACL|nr:hypothetical protein [Brevibacillus fortis]MED1785454.1 hypothetical protein [Brevibacillus fortis]PSJ85852.1 hypothetical protein C7R93_29135 [Brevibacillus fortis]